MDFTLNEEQKRLQATVKEVAEKKIAPHADEMDRKQEFPWESFRAAAEVGVAGLGIPVEYGGSGGNKMDTAIAFEEIARVCVSTAGLTNAHLLLCSEPIYLYGTEKQRRKYLPDLAKGKKVGAFAITEADAGSDISGIKTTAVRDGDSYIINGSKAFITNGDVAGTVVIFAGIPALGKRGMTSFIIEDGMPGFIKGKKYDKLGMRALTNCELLFDNCRVPVENRLGEEGQGMKICLSTLDRGRIGVGAQGVGIARAVLERSAAYAKQRVQFGAPIAQNQAISWMLADIATQLEAARLLVYKAAYLADRGEPFTQIAAMAKLYATELGMKAATEGIQIHGGYGYMMDSPMQRFFRDAKLTTIYEGTSEVQRMVISRSVLQ